MRKDRGSSCTIKRGFTPEASAVSSFLMFDPFLLAALCSQQKIGGQKVMEGCTLKTGFLGKACMVIHIISRLCKLFNARPG